MRQATIKSLCAQVLGVNRKNIYHESIQEEKDLQTKAAIEATHLVHPAYGQLRLSIHLQMNKKKIQRVMKKYGIKPPRRRVKKYYCTESVPNPGYPNLIRNYTTDYLSKSGPSFPHEVWVSDVSFFKFQGSFWYLATILDLYTRQIVGAHVGKKHDRFLVLKAVQEALLNSKQTPTIFHTDQGKEFMARDVTNYIQKLGIQVSTSDKASPWQNGYQESFFGRFKDEFGDINRCNSIGELIEELYHHIHYYNTQRIHTALKMPPSIYANSLRNLSDIWGT